MWRITITQANDNTVSFDGDEAAVQAWYSAALQSARSDQAKTGVVRILLERL